MTITMRDFRFVRSRGSWFQINPWFLPIDIQIFDHRSLVFGRLGTSHHILHSFDTLRFDWLGDIIFLYRMREGILMIHRCSLLLIQLRAICSDMGWRREEDLLILLIHKLMINWTFDRLKNYVGIRGMRIRTTLYFHTLGSLDKFMIDEPILMNRSNRMEWMRVHLGFRNGF